MKTIKVVSVIDGEPMFNEPLKNLLDKCVPGGALTVVSPTEYISLQQIRWWKGVLLPALSKETGDSVEYWETKLKLEVMPDEFVPFYISMGKQVFPVVPSITKLSIKKMNELIEGSVAKCHEYDMIWVTLPSSDLRKK